MKKVIVIYLLVRFQKVNLLRINLWDKKLKLINNSCKNFNSMLIKLKKLRIKFWLISNKICLDHHNMKIRWDNLFATQLKKIKILIFVY